MHHSNLTPHTPTRTLAATALLAVGLTLGGQAASAAPEPTASASTPASTPAEQLQHEASALERKQHWLGAVTQWRACMRKASEGSPLQAEALEHLRELAGITWRVHIDSKTPLPLVVGKQVIAIPYEVPYSDGVRSMVTVVDRATGKVLWTREDAHAYSHDGDVVVLAESWRQISRINLQNGLDLWIHPFGPAGSDKPLAQNRRVLELDGKVIYAVKDSWPIALELESGQTIWSEHKDALPGYHVLSTPDGFVCWPGEQRPASVSESAWQSAPLVLLSRDKGQLMWRKALLSGEPWKVTADREHVYLSNPRLDTERPWTALSMERGQTVWRLPQSQARSSSLAPVAGVLVEESAKDTSPATRIFDPASGRKLWESDKVIRVLPQGLALASGEGDEVAALNVRSGKPVWQISQDDLLRLDPVRAVADKDLFMTAAHAGALTGTAVPGAGRFSLQNGAPMWRIKGSESPFEDDLSLVGLAGDTLLLERSMLIARPKLDAHATQGVVRSMLAVDAGQGKVQWGLYGFSPLRAVPAENLGSSLLVAEADERGHSIYSFDLAKIEALVKAGRQWWWSL